jgi:hypothetical protein
LLKALAVKAAARFPTMQAVLDAWGEAGTGNAVAPRPAASPVEVPRPPRVSAKPEAASDETRAAHPGAIVLGLLLAIGLFGKLTEVSQIDGASESDLPDMAPADASDISPAYASALPPQGLISGRYRPVGPNGAIIHDITTGLHWMRCSQGQHWNGATCEGVAAKLIWEESMRHPAAQSFADQTDWRVPTKAELLTLVHCSSGQPRMWNDKGSSCQGKFESPTVDQVAFPNTPDTWFWSSSPDAYHSDYAWVVLFDYGGDGNVSKNGGYHVRLVRGGQ